MRWLNYQHFFYFWHVARLGSVTEAAALLRLAQPTISAQLKSFEDILGEPLFEREGRKLLLSDAGKIAFKYAEQIFSLGQEFLEVMDGKSEGLSKELKIGISDVVPKSLAYRLIQPAFGSGALVHCLEDKTERLLADLAIGEVDMVVADRPIPPTVKVKAYNHFIGESNVAFLAIPRIARKIRSNFPKSLSNAPILFPTHESAVRNTLEIWFEKKGLVLNCIAAFQDRALMKIAARDGQGVIIVPSVIEKEICKEYHLEVIGHSNEIKEQLYLITVEKRIKNPLVMLISSNAQKLIFR